MGIFISSTSHLTPLSLSNACCVILSCALGLCIQISLPKTTQVLSVLSKAVKDGCIATIDPVRSQSIGLALSRAPYRTFLSNGSIGGGESNLVIYQLPTSVTEYLSFGGSEASSVRSAILAGNSVVAAYDPKTSSFVGGSADTVLAALGGACGAESNASAKGALASAALTALSKLDQEASAQLDPSSLAKRKDVVIVVGSGGREHALAVALARSPLIADVICCPGNGGTAVEGGKIRNAEGVNGKQDNATVIDLVKRVGAHMVVVGPEAPLVDGLVDELAVQCPGVRAFGPTKAGAELEASKVRSNWVDATCDLKVRHSADSACIFSPYSFISNSFVHYTGLHKGLPSRAWHSHCQVPQLY